MADPGTLCPKHDVELIDGPEEDAIDPEIRSKLVTITSFGIPSEAQAPKLRLEAEGIPTFLVGERMGGLAAFQNAIGGIKLQVPEEYAAEARVILKQSWGPIDKDESEEDDPWEGLVPDRSERRRSIMKGCIIAFLLAPIVSALLGALLSQL